MFSSKTQNKQLLCNYGVFIINGMLALSIGSLLPYIRDARGLEYAFCGMIVSLHSVGNLISSFASGALPAFLGRKKSILLFNAFFALSFFIIIFSDNNYMLALSFFLTGMARGATSNFCNQSINELAPGKASLLNGLHAMFAIGAFTFPLLLIALTKNNPDNWIYACYFMLIMGILSWIMYFIIPNSEGFTTGTKKQTASGFAFFKEPLFYLCTLTMFFYLCAERMAASLYGIWSGSILPFIIVQLYDTVYSHRYYGLWFQHGRTLSYNCFLCRKYYSEVYPCMELYLNHRKLRGNYHAFHYR